MIEDRERLVRKTLREKLIFWALFAVWLGCFGLSLDDLLREKAYSPLLVAPAASSDGYPTVAALKPGLGAEASGLVAGDRLLAIGEMDLRGAGAAAWTAGVARFEGREIEMPIDFERGGVRGSTLLHAGSLSQYWPRLVASLAFAACALLLFLRMAASELERRFVLMNLVLATVEAVFFAGGLLETRVSTLR